MRRTVDQAAPPGNHFLLHATGIAVGIAAAIATGIGIGIGARAAGRTCCQLGKSAANRQSGKKRGRPKKAGLSNPRPVVVRMLEPLPQ